MKKKILLSEAVIMIVIISIFLSVSVFAWISVITGVKIQNIQVTPAGAQALSIKNSSTNSKFAFTVSPSSNSVSTLNPVSTYDTKKWYKPANVVSINENGTYSQSTTFTPVSTTEAQNYYFHEEFIITSSSVMTSLRVSNITVKNADGSEPQSDYSKSLRVGIVIGSSSNPFIYAPVSGGNTSYEAISSVEDFVSTATVNTTSVGTGTLLQQIAADEQKTIHVYVWYEGQDTNCTTYALSAETLSITIEFTAEPNINSDVG